MAYYLIEAAYTPEAWAAMVKNPQNRRLAIQPAIEKLGGCIESFWLALGEYDAVAIVQMPDNLSAAAFSVAASAGGSVKAFKTIPLLSVDEGIIAMKKAGAIGYKPPRG